MPSESADIRREVAQLAARYIADSGLDHGAAKQRAARELLGAHPRRDALPDNDEVDEALREHLELFDEEHPQRVRRMGAVALDLMQRLEAFHPLVTGAVWKGIIAADAPIHLQLFCDNPKEVEYWLIDQGTDFEALTVPHWQSGRDTEALALEWRGEPVLLSLYDLDDQRGALRGGPNARRGDRAALAARLTPPPPTDRT